MLESSTYSIQSYSETVPMQSLKIQIQSNKKEKFQLCSKLVHELAANLQETYKDVERAHKLQY